MYLLKFKEAETHRSVDFPSIESLISYIEEHKITDFEVNRTRSHSTETVATH